MTVIVVVQCWRLMEQTRQLEQLDRYTRHIEVERQFIAKYVQQNLMDVTVLKARQDAIRKELDLEPR